MKKDVKWKVARWIALLFCHVLAIFVFMGGAFAVVFGSLHPGTHLLLWLAFVLGLCLALVRLVCRRRWLVRVGLGLSLAAVLGAAGISACDWWTKDRFDKVENRVDWWDYKPFAPGNKLVKAECPDAFRFEGWLPRISCAYALYPVGAAAVEALCPKALYKDGGISPESSPMAFDRLVADSADDCWGVGRADVILALAPSEKQKAAAAEAGFEFELTPVTKDAFVFFVPVSNPVRGLTSQQVKDIYSGKTTTWKELGVNLQAKMLPYQRNEGSGSQTALERLMEDTPLMEPLKEDRLGGMGGIISDTADYRNHPGALGFSFRYYATELVRENKIKLLEIDGVAPTVENIRSGAYPFVETAYAITVRPRVGNVGKFIDFLVSPAGRDLIEKTGYVAP